MQHDTRLYSYLLDPTYSSHGLPEVALRRFNLKLSGTLAEAADITGRLATTLRNEIETVRPDEALRRNRPAARSGARAHGSKPASRSTAKLLARHVDAPGKRDRRQGARKSTTAAGCEFNINSPKQLGDVLFNKLNLPKPVKYGKGKTISTAVDVLEGLAAEHEAPQLVLEYRQLSKLKSTYVDALPALLNPSTGRLHTTFDQTGTATGRLSSANPNLQNIPIRTEVGPRDPRRLHRRARPRAARRRLFADRVAPAGALLERSSCWSRPSAVATTFIPSPPRRSSACRR